jgi:hypothetical protein
MNVPLFLVAVGVAGEFIGNQIAGPIRKRLDAIQKAEIETLRQKNLELEKSLTPRTLSVISVNRKSNIEGLKRYAGTEAIVEFIPDLEAARAANSIKFILESAGWKITRFGRSVEDISDGVAVKFFHAPTSDWPVFQAQGKSIEKASALVDFLKDNNWVAHIAWSMRGELGENSIKVEVGFKPSPYFDPPQLKEAQREADKAIKEMRERMERNRKAFEEQSPLPPKNE